MRVSFLSPQPTSRRTLVVRRIFLRKMRLHRSGCRSSPRKVTLGSAARLQAPSLTPRCRYQLFAVEGHCSLGIYFVTPTQRQAAAPTSRRTLVVRRIFLRKMRLHRSGCRSSPRKVTLGSAARLQAPSLTPHCRYQLFAVEGHCSLGIYFITPTQRQAAAPKSRSSLLWWSRFLLPAFACEMKFRGFGKHGRGCSGTLYHLS